MKNIGKKIVVMLLLTFTCAALLTGCTKKFTVEESVEIFYDIFTKLDITRLEELGIEGEELENFTNTEIAGAKDGLVDSFKTSDLQATEEQTNKLLEAIFNSFKKLECTVEVKSKEKGIAEVKIGTTFIEFKYLAKELLDETINEVMAKDLEVTEEELERRFMESYLNKLVTALENVQVSQSTISETFEFKKEKFEGENGLIELWIPVNEEKFYKRLENMIMGQ